MILSAIVAASDNNVIGRRGEIPWRIKGEQARVKAITMGHPLIMGRRTHQSIGRTLPGRLNIVLSAQPGFQASPEAIVVRSFEEALRLPQVTSSDEVFIFGGDKLYREAMPRLMRLYLTRVHLSVEGDAFFEFNPAEWKLSSEERHPAEADQPAYDYLVYERT